MAVVRKTRDARIGALEALLNLARASGAHGVRCWICFRCVACISGKKEDKGDARTTALGLLQVARAKTACPWPLVSVGLLPLLVSVMKEDKRVMRALRHCWC
jgi:hypothetical protein